MKKKVIFWVVLVFSLLFFSTAGADQSMVLKNGFNFVGFTAQLSLTAAQFKALNSAIEDVYLYSPAAGSFLSVQDGTLASLSAGKGYIVKISSAQDVSLNVTGAELSLIGNISLKAGFNLAGFSKMPETVKFSELMARQPKIKGMYKWSLAAGTFIQVVRNAAGAVEQLDGSDPVIKAGESYFINLTEDLPLNYDGASVVIGTSPAEAVIAFVSNRNGRNEIFTMTASGASQKKISNHQETVHSPAVSPDGTKVAYVVEAEGKYDIYSMNIDGTAAKRLTTDGYSSWPAWSPDGTKLAYSRSLAEIWTMNSDGSSQAKITLTLPGSMDRIGHPCWSPDGTKIAVTGFFSASSNIYYIKLADSTLHQLTYNVGMNMGPAWSPDGSKIVFGSSITVGLDSIYKIYVMNSDGSNQKELSASGAESFSVKYCWSPDGTKIAFSEKRAADNNYSQIYIMSSDGSAQTRLTDPSTLDNSAPSFAAPGR